jgi:hypothetical protein
LALAYATKGNIKAKALAKQLRSFNPREADMISGILLAGQGKNREASRMLATAFVGLRKDPWPIVGLARHALAAATELARNDSHCARELLEALKEPFLVDYADDDRRWTACSIATRISPQVALPWIESYEPHIPWELSFLTLRDRVYAITRHALAAQAQADLACFLQNESSLSTTP